MTEEFARYTIIFLNPEEKKLETQQIDGRGPKGDVRLPLYNSGFGFSKDGNDREI